MILQKSGLKKEDLDELLSTLLKYVHIIPNEILQQNLPAAKKEMKEIDKDDVVFLAAAMTIDGVI